ncbi:MAG: hypothetical protein COV55_02335 [Candidatus Komeilibacteria bacterium CG11_big_fil_rev_8_21_14_0_20_36_20]|uniref:Methyltransferase type 11 domain-containing protein n=1 Tax=Candidatus Komeilibacteria bacterium CG11_big_fil_rev_8_21_14_0_20_36_20 TaxID=1974477 RepID=A0A2H0NFC8_9BACT|nr:MAG: hypothetical protein COV55_02335 [Candidatus Komeilibacteria bacterium CG11_big_fil_rev_8_21_14_0_20_36_20]PIR81812.1 MAG: hypothetical protein COU21_01395 [Candidatus Komeilibacteria bacterium CG10_big_fil_rev_8_21_14_0_10_36_65]PJC55302.1 MAG: hypothetical protein CO027_02730 [Candidatus Komeilibacteria bacterium CG_4_9_14_0_2_um_filter_36_13]
MSETQTNPSVNNQNVNQLNKDEIMATSTLANQQSSLGKSELLNFGNILKNILQLQPGNIVADLGAGGGLFTMQAARLVGDRGQVYAVDVVKGTLGEIESKARMIGLYNIKIIWSNLEIVGATKIPEGSLDFALLVNILFQSKKHYEIIAEGTRLLKSGGKLLIIDWSNTTQGFAPPDDLQVDQEKIQGYAQQLDLKLLQSFKAGKYHFGLIFEKE